MTDLEKALADIDAIKNQLARGAEFRAGLWQILFSLGIFASCHLLPKALFAAGVWYLVCGLIGIAIAATGHWVLSPWVMGVPFGVGQLIFAAILYRTLGASDAQV